MQFELSDDDVISTAPEKVPLSTQTYKCRQLKEAFKFLVKNYSFWFDEGASGSVMRQIGGGWRKGKIRFVLVFVPDDVEETPLPPGYGMD